jgi:peptidoglycan/xylan/chitin deacetylase (PgdA/CDA1 family)
MRDARRQPEAALFRNDDVDCDTDAGWLSQISAVLARYRAVVIHAVTVRGISSVPEGAMMRLDNDEIVGRGGGKEVGCNRPLIECLASRKDEQIALHGLYHVHIARLGYSQQRAVLSQGLGELRELFPDREIELFVPPFDEYDENTLAVCSEMGLRVLSDPEALNLDNVVRDRRPLPRDVHRYPFVYFHHKRYYPNEHVLSWRSDLTELERRVRWIAGHRRWPRWSAIAVDKLRGCIRRFGKRAA